MALYPRVTRFLASFLSLVCAPLNTTYQTLCPTRSVKKKQSVSLVHAHSPEHRTINPCSAQKTESL